MRVDRPSQSRGNVADETSGKIQETYLEYYKAKLATMAEWTLIESLCPDLIVANDVDCLVLANLIFKQAKIVFDAHEYAPLEYSYQDDWWSKYEQPARIWACQTFLPSVASMSTVCRGIAAEFERNFDIPCGIEIVTNAPLFECISPKPTGKIIRLVHHGLGSPLRKIELMAEAIKLLGSGYELNLMLVEGDPEYINDLRSKYEMCGNINFLEPVPMPEIAKFISRFDIGIFILEPEIFNYEWALPNKFFEFVQARLAIAVGPSPEMAGLVQEFGLGVVASDFSPEAMARALIGVSPTELDKYKANSDRCADIFCAEANKRVMLEMIGRALKRDFSEVVA